MTDVKVVVTAHPASKSATSSPTVAQKRSAQSPASLSVLSSHSPRVHRSGKFPSQHRLSPDATERHVGVESPMKRRLTADGPGPRPAISRSASTAENGTCKPKSTNGPGTHQPHGHQHHHHRPSTNPSSTVGGSAATVLPQQHHQPKPCAGGGSNGSDHSSGSDGKITPPWKQLQQPHSSFGSKLPANRHHHQYSSFRNPNLKLAAHGSPSLRSLKASATAHLDDRLAGLAHGLLPPSPSLGSFTYSDIPPVCSLKPSDGVSVKSLVSIGMGSTDGRKLVIRRVPTSPTELLNIAHPDTMDEDDEFSSCSSFTGTFHDFGPHYKPRGRQYRWSNKLQFILACVGYSIGLGNIWRLPYFCYKSGGGIFFIPYFIILILCGVPLLYMELTIGQFTRRGPIGALSKLCPLFKGVGLSGVAVSFFLSTYYNVIIAYTLFYLFSAFRAEVPWDSCNNRWNTVNCWKSSLAANNKTKLPFSKTSAEEFYTKKVLQISSGIHEFGEMRWELMACLLIVWILVYFALWKSVRSSGRVLYFTATIPFVLVFVFLGYALGLQGADKGVEYLLSPKWDLLLDSKVWVNAAAQNLNSIGIAFGSVISFASYNKYNNQILHDTIAVSIINGVTSILVAIFAFATIGNIAWEQETSIENVITDGPGLAFVVYPQALSKMSFVNFWSALFFFTLLCVSLNSQFAIVEVIVTSVQDGFPNWIKRKLVCHEILVLVVCVISFLVGLPHVSQGGMFFFQLIDYYVASVAIIYVAFFEVIAITWIYGADRLSNDIQKMTTRKPSFFFIYCWKIATPLILMCIWLFSLYDFEPLTYNNDEYKYPAWAQTIGWIITFSTLSCIPILGVYVVLHSEGDSLLEKLRNSLIPHLEDYGSHNSDDLHHHAMKSDNIKELNTLLDYRIPNDNGANSVKRSMPELLPKQNHE